MDINRLLQQIASTRQSLFDERHLNQQFVALENHGRATNDPYFVERLVHQYFGLTDPLITKMEKALEKDAYNFLVQLTFADEVKLFTTSIGANNVMIKADELRVCIAQRQCTQSQKEVLQRLKREQEILKNKLELYFRMLRWYPPTVIDDKPEFDDDDDESDGSSSAP